MGDYHFVYKDLEGASTQWDDIQRKLGNLPPKAPAFKPPPFTPASDDQPKDKTWIDSKTSEELEDLEDNLDDDRFLQEYRKKRLAEMQEAAKVLRFGSVIPISGSDFVREVSQAPSDVWVVVILYKEGIPECGLLMQSIEELALRYPSTKFVKIISTDCIPNYPDRNLPTLLVYNNGAVKGNYVGLHSFGRRCTPEDLFGVIPLVLNNWFMITTIEKEHEVPGKEVPAEGCEEYRMREENDLLAGLLLVFYNGLEIKEKLKSRKTCLMGKNNLVFLCLSFPDCLPETAVWVLSTQGFHSSYLSNSLSSSYELICNAANGVALVLCQSDPVLNDGHNGNEAIIEGVRKRFIEKVVADHEEGGDDDYSSD
ncbi:hypothetical protein JHK84_035188 [Glycine max]|uniref:Viral IAP-associated factor-like n=1 Tax=Glycine soja TaxID=3848 RepID=A0A445HUR4_GLYSO|nr:hypothetical protein JHK86_034926 [Glycine max]KAG5141420.1 hypothetical protein JHK84_035188 [Glycine max]RZB77445.1 Viral IAP-associated factor-like [Glycine soja]